MKIAYLLFLIAMPLHAQVFVSGGVAKMAITPGVPTISGVTQSPDANSIVLSWATDVPSNTWARCGANVAPSDASQNSVTSHQIAVAELTPSTPYSCQVCSGGLCQSISATTNAPLTSTPITGISLSAPTPYPDPTMTGDVFPTTISNDNITYVLNTDTTGFNGGSFCEFATVIGKFTSFSPMAITNVNTFNTFTPGCTPLAANGNLSPHGWGLMSMAGKLFLSWTNVTQCAGVPVCMGSYGNMAWSPDHGATWNSQTSPAVFTTGGAFNSPTTTRMSPNGPPYFDYTQFVMEGQDDGTLGYATANNRHLNANVYSYQISNAQNSTGLGISCAGDSYYLRRVPRSQLADLNPLEYEYYIGGDGTQAAAWSHDQTRSAAVLTNTGNGANLPSYPGELCLATEQWIPALNRYAMQTSYWPNGVNNAGSSVWLTYDTPTPWGPYTLVSTLATQPTATGYEAPFILQGSALAATFSGTTMQVIAASNPLTTYSMNIFTMTVNH